MQQADTDRARTLLDIVTRSSSNENEAMNAVRQLCRMRDRVGDLAKLFPQTIDGSRAAPPVSYNESRRKISDLEEDRDRWKNQAEKAEARVSTLTVEVARLREELTASKEAVAVAPKSKDGSLPYRVFVERATAFLGRGGWSSEFVRQTKIERTVLTRAQYAGIAPPELVQLLSTLRVPDQRRSVTFSPSEVKDIRAWAKKHADPKIADLASEKFGRIITKEMLRKLRSDIRNQTGGYSQEDYGDPLPVLEGRNAVFQWERFPDIERFVCDNQFKQNRLTAIELAQIVSDRSGIKVNEGAIKQRVDNAVPPAYMLKGMTHVGALTWPELWYLGSRLSKRGWKQEVFEFLGIKKRTGGDSLDDISSESVERLRKTVLGNTTDD